MIKTMKKLLVFPPIDIPKQERHKQPIALAPKLLPHQRVGLTWLIKQEEDNHKGGILADTMGLGKTVQALALILARPSKDSVYKTTLIVAPLALLKQWEREIEDKVKPGRKLKTLIFHGGKKRGMTVASLLSYDVVLTTYGTVAAEDNPRKNQKTTQVILSHNTRFHRVILDEAHNIKNRATKAAKAIFRIRSDYRLCMTGTPLMNNTAEIFSPIHFLRIAPFHTWEVFNREFEKPIKAIDKNRRAAAMKKLQALLRNILLQRTSTTEIDGKPCLDLPELITENSEIELDEEQRQFYDFVERRMQIKFNKYAKAGLNRNYSHILVLILRLRQICCHPHLIDDYGIPEGAEIGSEEMIQLACKLNEHVVDMIKEQEEFQCPLCGEVTGNPIIIYPCGHHVCGMCFTGMMQVRNPDIFGEEMASPCPSLIPCSQTVNPRKVLCHSFFVEAHTSEDSGVVTSEDDLGEDSEDSEDSDEIDDADEDGDLEGFVVSDKESITAKADEPTAKKSRDNKRKSKRQKMRTLADLKKESTKNAVTKLQYLERLREDWETSAKIDKTMELLRGFRKNPKQGKTLVFSAFTSFLDLLEVPVHDDKFKYRRYDGGMNNDARDAAVDDFMNKPEVEIMLVSLRAGNAGLNLQMANQVIILDPFWNPSVEDQAVGRAHRIGQKNPFTVYRLLVEDTIEDRIVELQEKKRALVKEVLSNEAAQGLGRLSYGELHRLFFGGRRRAR
ncbi:SNF2 family N-terminal domain-containing protein [Xylariales sp. AK1849]|nr:SNF2 family N-terminal domain-containing protein [Xylariales sp. AK1849]